MNKYVFLDIDGVIATPETIIHGMWGLTPEKQDLLGLILEKTDAKIVLSSSWRKHTLEETITYMNEQGFNYSDKIVGVTIRAYHYIEKGIHLSIPRGVEVKQWIDVNVRYPWIGNPERNEEYRIYNEDGSFKMMRSNVKNVDYKFVILDDDNDFLLEHQDDFFQTDSEIGLTEEIVVKIINKFNND